MNAQKIMQGVGFGLVYLGVLIDIVIGEFTVLPVWLNEVANILCIFGAGLATGTIPNRVESIIENGGDKNADIFQSNAATNATSATDNEVITPNTETIETTLTAENTTQSEKRAF